MNNYNVLVKVVFYSPKYFTNCAAHITKSNYIHNTCQIKSNFYSRQKDPRATENVVSVDKAQKTHTRIKTFYICY